MAVATVPASRQAQAQDVQQKSAPRAFRRSEALHAEHRFSMGADQVPPGPRERFDTVLGHIETVAGWKAARLARPEQVLGNLDGDSDAIFDHVCDAT